MSIGERVLTFVVRDPDHRDSILGDLIEERGRLARRAGEDRASRWHLRQSVSIAFRYGATRLLRRTPPARWIALADAEPDGPWWSGLPRDLRHAWRAIWQRPALSLVVIMTLAIALAANSTTFSLMDALVLRPYRFAGVDRLIIPTTQAPDDEFFDRANVTAGDFREWRDQAKTVKQWAMYRWWDANLSGVDVPEQLAGFTVSPGYFSLLGVKPELGREFLDSEGEVGHHQRVVIGHGVWTRRFAADPQIIGKTIRLDDEPYEVVGVAPPGFNTPDGAEVWAPIALTDEQWADRRHQDFGIIARLADGYSIDAARAELTTVVDNQRHDHPDTNAKRSARVLTFTKGMADPGAGAFISIWQAAALLLLFIACANIANLLMARGAERSAEYALRLALGASRVRLFVQTLLEGGVLAVLAIAVSMPLTAIGLGLSRASIPASVLRFIPGWDFIRLDLELFLMTAALGTGALLLFSVLPAFQAVRSQVAETLRQSGRSLTPGRHRQVLRSVLATTQMALALALLFASTLALAGANRTVNGVLGFDKANVLVAQLNLPERRYLEPETRRRFITNVTDAMRTIPAVTNVGVTSMIPAAFNNESKKIYPEGQLLKEQEARTAEYRRVSPEYFTTMRIPLLSGRTFNDGDRADATPVAIVSSGFARRYWEDQDPIGKRFKTTPDGPWLTVIGVSGNVVHNWFVRQTNTIYRPITQDAPFAPLSFAVRTVGDPAALSGDLRRAIAAQDPDQPIAALAPLDRMVEERAAGFVFIARALGVVGAIALVLSLMGIYSLMAFLTGQRTQEIGVRMALGASRRQVVGATITRAIWITVAAASIGSVLALGAGQVMTSVLSGLVSVSMWLLVAITALLASVALAAAYIPARRAAAIDPMTALRES